MLRIFKNPQIPFMEYRKFLIGFSITISLLGVVLYQFGTGPIKGFAVTLIIGLCASMFTAIFVSRFLFDFFFKYRERVETLSI